MHIGTTMKLFPGALVFLDDMINAYDTPDFFEENFHFILTKDDCPLTVIATSTTKRNTAYVLLLSASGRMGWSVLNIVMYHNYNTYDE